MATCPNLEPLLYGVRVRLHRPFALIVLRSQNITVPELVLAAEQALDPGSVPLALHADTPMF
jgi:hypothetical protein